MSDGIQPPNVHPDDAPLVSICVNEKWIPYIIGMIWPARYPEYWGGTLEENRTARKDVMQLMSMLQGGEYCMVQNCCVTPPEIRRVNPTTGVNEVSYDNGTTWGNDPDGLPKYIYRPQPPITSGVVDNKCDAAQNVQDQVQVWVDHVTNDFDTAVVLLDFALGVAEAILVAVVTILTAGVLTAVQAAILPAIAAACTAAWGAGKTVFTDYWESDTVNLIRCFAFCTIGDDGSFNDAQFSAFWNKCNSELAPSPAKMLFMGFLSSVGASGLCAMAATGEASGTNCDDCACVPGCDNDFIVYPNTPNYFGIIVEQTPTYVIVKTDVINTNSNYYTYLVADPPENCCVINHTQYFLSTTDEADMTYENMLANGVQGNVGGADCGDTIPGTIGPKTTDNCLNQVQMQDGSPFAVMYLKDHC